eukprot:TRINITY_DN100421_c0_g1_i1.p1 TRINITY_DN100421_c0_g1~~TRINITY_DN100421_c0_g1_i1.p1  ORF type:complete len:543 (+),score=77.38 TRINITY_DN100421_c0_g1_i1:176-1804(+)
MAAGEKAAEEVRQVFRSWDLNSDGFISKDEFCSVLQQLGFAAADAACLFEAADIDGNGRVDFDEFLTWLFSDGSDISNIRQRIKTTRMFREVHRGKAGTLVDEEILSTVENITAAELDELSELRRLRVPPKVVRRALEVLCLILNPAKNPKASKPPTWTSIQKTLGNENFIDCMRDFDVEHLRKAPSLCNYLVTHYFGDDAPSADLLGCGEERLTYQRVAKASVPVSALFKWCTMELATAGVISLPDDVAVNTNLGCNPLNENASAGEPTCEPAVADEKVSDATPPAEADEEVGVSPLSKLPTREQVVNPEQVLLLMMTGCQEQALDLATSRKKEGPCAKCDEGHHEDECPHFAGRRDDWETWAKRKGALMEQGGEDGDGQAGDTKTVEVTGEVVVQPGDGSCLFHSLAYNMKKMGMGSGSLDARGPRLRQAVAKYLAEHADETVAGTSFRDYILWDRGLTIEEYLKDMADSSIWGGAVEIAAFIRMERLNVQIYDPIGRTGKFRRVLSFEYAPSSGKCSIVWSGKYHYDALHIGPAFPGML